MQVMRTKNEIYKAGTEGDFRTNEMFIMSITNNVGYSLWNSYTTNYPGQPTIFVNDYIGMSLTNGAFSKNAFTNFSALIDVPSAEWTGAVWNVKNSPNSRTPAANSFKFGNWSFAFLPTSVYNFAGADFLPVNDVPTPTFDTNLVNLPNLPQFGLIITNHLVAYILDRGHVVDYVQLGGPNSVTNLNNELQDVLTGANNPPYGVWYTNASGTATPPNGPSLGLANQLTVSKEGSSVAPPSTPSAWVPPPNMPSGLQHTPAIESSFFLNFFTGGSGVSGPNTNLVQQAPYTPSGTRLRRSPTARRMRALAWW